MKQALTILKDQMKQLNLTDLIITDYYNLKYFADVDIQAGERMLALLLNEKGNYLFVNELFTAKESEDYSIIYFNDTQDPIEILSTYLTGSNIAVDGKWTASFLLRLMSKHPATYTDHTDKFAKIRLVKTKEEQEKMIQASKDNDEVMSRIIPYIQLGITEKQIYNTLLGLFEEITHEPVSFEPIVAFGANAADPHHVSDDTVLKEGEAVLIDMGSHYQGYCSDMTRTFLQKNDKIEEIYEIVKQANILAEQAIKPGKKLKDIDKVARDYITSFGYGQYFTHRLGHGIGLEIHEPYDVSQSSETVIVEGMCFSIEPGIYLPNIGGVRIEDLVIVQKDKALVLNSFSKEKQFI